jgi:peptide-methionine (R)-S-oxide reductase
MTDETDWKAKLTTEQYRVLREKGTERPFTGDLLNVKDRGKFACVACGNMLFSSETKFESGTGWPSFEDALPGAVEFHRDTSHGMTRTEVTCGNCGSHLGHVFDDGPGETGKRYCINSVCLKLEKSSD